MTIDVVPRRAINRVVVRGELLEPPELSDTRSGESVANLKLLVPSSADGERFYMFNVRAYGAPADEIYDSDLTTGDTVDIQGFLKQEKWPNRETGRRVSRVVIVTQKTKKVGNAHPEVSGQD